MFKQLKNIDSAFKHVRTFSIFLIISCVSLCGYTVYTSLTEVANMQGKIYILYNGKLIEAFATDRARNIPVELRDHISTFHYWFFTLDPDEKENKRHLLRALYLADGSAKSVYDNLRESGFYQNVISGNITQRVETDSIHLNLMDKKYRFRFYGKITITRPTSIVVRSLVTEGRIRQVSRSENNPHGFLIERWQIMDNHDLKVSTR